MSRIEYIVLDHAQHPDHMIEALDRDGRRFLVVSPSFLDNFRHVSGISDSSFASWWGIPIYRYEDVKDWFHRKEGNT